MEKAWRIREDYRPFLKKARHLYLTYLGHVNTDRVLLCGVQGNRGRYIAQIRPIRPPFSLLSSKFDYIIEVKEDKFDSQDEAFKIYIMVHEMWHIHQEGFKTDSSNHRKMIDHDVQDFNYLLVRCGIRMENVQDILKGEKELLKAHKRRRFPRYEVIH